MMNILHITYQWPNIINPHSGIFIKNIVANQLKYSENDFFVIIPSKIINKDYLKRKKLNIKNYTKFICNKNYYYQVPNLLQKQKLFFPIFGISKLTGYNSQLCWLQTKKGIINFIRENRIDLIHIHRVNPDGYMAYKVSKKYKIPYIMHIHGFEVQQYRELTKKEQDDITLVFENASHFFCNSNKTRLLLSELFNIKENVSVIEFGIDGSVARNNVELSDPVKIISVGNLIKIKGIQYVVEALNSVKDEINFHYTIVGDGPMRTSIVNQINGYNLNSRVTLTGRLDNTEVMKLLIENDIFILPSYNEAFGMVYLEALSKGCSVVGVKGQGCEDINRYGNCIYLVKPKDSTSIVQCLKEIIENKNKRCNYIIKGYEVIKKHYTWKSKVEKIDNLYNSLHNEF